MKWIKNNVIMFTFISVTILFLGTYDMGVKSLSALWHTDKWMLYALVLGLNGILFMIGDNQIYNKLAGLMLIGVVLFPISSLEQMSPDQWSINEWIHHTCAILFFIFKSKNHRKYDFIIISVGATALLALGLHIYTVEIIGLYTLLYTGYLKKKNYFRDTRTYLTNKNK